MFWSLGKASLALERPSLVIVLILVDFLPNMCRLFYIFITEYLQEPEI